jgi:hypothetical protein
MNICVNQCHPYQVRNHDRIYVRYGDALSEMNTIIHRPITFYDNYYDGNLVHDPYKKNDGEESDQDP